MLTSYNICINWMNTAFFNHFFNIQENQNQLTSQDKKNYKNTDKK